MVIDGLFWYEKLYIGLHGGDFSILLLLQEAEHASQKSTLYKSKKRLEGRFLHV